MKRISCIIFDLDGTLSQTNELIYATFNHVSKKYIDKVFTPQEIVAMFGPPEEVAIENLVGKDNVDDAMDEFCEYYGEHHPRLAAAYEGVPDLLQFLKERGILLALFTGKGKRTALITLKELRITQFFDLIVTGNDVVNHKPSADGIRKVLKTFHLQPDEVLMVGDSVSDIKAAHEAGVPVAAVLWDSYGKEKVMEMNADVQFHNVQEFSSWIRTAILDSGARTH
jgi:pyrophosphatase PpaX